MCHDTLGGSVVLMEVIRHDLGSFFFSGKKNRLFDYARFGWIGIALYVVCSNVYWQ